MNDMAVSYARHRVTVDEYHRMGEAGVFPHDARIELIEGELVETLVSMNPPHAVIVEVLNKKLTFAVADRALVRCQLPITLGDASEPEPDFALVRGPRLPYKERHPGPDDIMCVIEVADSSRAFDLRTKAPLYAEFEVPETWVVDLVERRVHVLRVPHGRAYMRTTVATVDDVISLLAFPDVYLKVADIFE